jgi:hypothetical protein
MGTLRDSRAKYFEDNHFGADGGYGSPYVLVKVFKLPVAFPNTEGRVKAVRFHDLHHLLTGYATDFAGEAEIAAWELASGCRRHGAAWVLNLYALGLGTIAWPKRMLAAFARGRRSRNLYNETFDDALLDRDEAQVRQELGLSEPTTPTAADGMALVPYALGSAALSLATAAILPLPLAGIAVGAVLARKAAPPSAA